MALQRQTGIYWVVAISLIVHTYSLTKKTPLGTKEMEHIQQQQLFHLKFGVKYADTLVKQFLKKVLTENKVLEVENVENAL